MNVSHIDKVQSFVRFLNFDKRILKLLENKKISRFITSYAEIIRAVNIQNQELLISNAKDNFCRKFTLSELITYFSEIHQPIPIQLILEAGKDNIPRNIIGDLVQFGEIDYQKAKKLAFEQERKQKALFSKKRHIENGWFNQNWENSKVIKDWKKQILLQQLREQFEFNFLDIYTFYEDNCSDHISFQDYLNEKANFITTWIPKNSDFKPDFEQAAAISTIENDVQVVARAGSGKTSTLVNRALFLQKHCGVAPHQMLLLAFNRRAAEEMRERLAKHLGDNIPHVMTFHALAYALVHPEDNLLINSSDGQQSKSRALQSVIDDYLHHPNYMNRVRDVMKAHFLSDWERIVSGGYHLSSEEMLQYRRSLPKETLRSEYVKSFGEKVIADFLFEHDINYVYERNVWWNGINYHPDFTIFTGEKQGLIIEYFGLEGDPDYDEMSEQKRKYWRGEPNWYLLELFPMDINANNIEGFKNLIKQFLESHGITCNRLSEEEIWLKIRDRAIDRFTKVMESFIQRCRKLVLTQKELDDKIIAHICTKDIDNVEIQFLDIAQIFYQAYLDRLEATGEEDFDGLMQKAAELVNSGQTEFLRKSGTGDLRQLRYIFIDEYQDFSKLFHNLIEAIRKQNPLAQFFCVGDDWQAINGFAGSDLQYYENFTQFFPNSQKRYITTNYRSAPIIVELGNALMQGRGTSARSGKSIVGKIEVVDVTAFEPHPREQKEHLGDSFTPVILRLVNKAIQQNKEVVMLSRMNSLPWFINYAKFDAAYAINNQLEKFLSFVRSHFPEQQRQKITISTTHKYKGLEKKVVIVLDAVARRYPLIHGDWIFTRALGDSIEGLIDEERRLFYVALTRAIEHLYILTEKGNFSPFLEDLKSRIKLDFINWQNYSPIVRKTQHITVKVSNQNGRGSNPTILIKDFLKAESFTWQSSHKCWVRTYPAQDFSFQAFLDKAIWLSKADGITVGFYDDLDNLLETYFIDKGKYRSVSTHTTVTTLQEPVESSEIDFYEDSFF